MNYLKTILVGPETDPIIGAEIQVKVPLLFMKTQRLRQIYEMKRKVLWLSVSEILKAFLVSSALLIREAFWQKCWQGLQ